MLEFEGKNAADDVAGSACNGAQVIVCVVCGVSCMAPSGDAEWKRRRVVLHSVSFEPSTLLYSIINRVQGRDPTLIMTRKIKSQRTKWQCRGPRAFHTHKSMNTQMATILWSRMLRLTTRVRLMWEMSLGHHSDGQFGC